jgi:hypothetical protein
MGGTASADARDNDQKQAFHRDLGADSSGALWRRENLIRRSQLFRDAISGGPTLIELRFAHCAPTRNNHWKIFAALSSVMSTPEAIGRLGGQPGENAN